MNPPICALMAYLAQSDESKQKSESHTNVSFVRRHCIWPIKCHPIAYPLQRAPALQAARGETRPSWLDTNQRVLWSAASPALSWFPGLQQLFCKRQLGDDSDLDIWKHHCPCFVANDTSCVVAVFLVFPFYHRSDWMMLIVQGSCIRISRAWAFISIIDGLVFGVVRVTCCEMDKQRTISAVIEPCWRSLYPSPVELLTPNLCSRGREGVTGLSSSSRLPKKLELRNLGDGSGYFSASFGEVPWSSVNKFNAKVVISW